MNPIIYEKVRDHLNNGTANSFLDRIEEIINTQTLNKTELQHLHFFCFVLILNDKYPKATVIAGKLAKLRDEDRQQRNLNQSSRKRIKLSTKQHLH